MLGVDKVLHFLLSFLIALYDPLVSFVAGVGKECYDSLAGGVADAYDLLADWTGIATALLVRFLMS
jgi:hypothetical protein